MSSDRKINETQFALSCKIEFSKIGLNIRLVSECELGIGVSDVEVAVLEQFGASRGMILLPTGFRIVQHHEFVTANGYGYSVLNEVPKFRSGDPGSFLKVLKDWGWSGLASCKPNWLK